MEGSEFGQSLVSESDFSNHVHRSSLCRAKQKLRPELFLALIKEQAIEAAENWHGHRVCSIDGSYLTLPRSKSIEREFPMHRQTDYYPKALLAVAMDVFTGQPLNARIGPFDDSEHALLNDMLDDFDRGDILLLDRLYFGFRLWMEITDRGLQFVHRLKSGNWLYDKMIRSRKKELLIAVEHQGTALKLRLIKSPSKRQTPLILVTSMTDMHLYPREEVIELYKKRWEVETLYCRIKQNFKLQKWHTKTAAGVRREIMAGLLALSIVAKHVYKAMSALKEKATRWKVNFKFAILVLRRTLIRPMTDKAIQRLLTNCLCEISAGRSYPRYSKQPQNKWISLRRPSWKNKGKGGRAAKLD